MRPYNKVIFKLDKGNQFKGHQGMLSVSDMGTGNGQIIGIVNKYFSGLVMTNVNPKRNNCSRTVTAYQAVPKWLEKKRDELLSLTNLGNKTYYWEFKEGNMTYCVEPYQISVTYTEELEGCKITGHKENIDELNNLNKLLSKYKAYVKKTETKELIPYLTLQEGYTNWGEDVANNVIDDVQTIPSYKKLLNKIRGWFK